MHLDDDEFPAEVPSDPTSASFRPVVAEEWDQKTKQVS